MTEEIKMFGDIVFLSALFSSIPFLTPWQIVKRYHKWWKFSSIAFSSEERSCSHYLYFVCFCSFEEISTTLDVEVDKVLQVLDTKELTLESSKIHTDLINVKC